MLLPALALHNVWPLEGLWRTRGARVRGLLPASARPKLNVMSARIGSEPTRRLFLAAIAVAPSAVFVAANVLQYGLGVRGAADWMNPLFQQPAIGWLVTGIILAGPILCFLLAASRLLPIRLVRDGDAWEVRLRVRADIRALVLVGLSAGVGGILAGHLLAENLACMLGIAVGC